MVKPFADASEQNKAPIARILQRYVEGRQRVLEIGSGTGQHAVYFASLWPWLQWQTSDLDVHHDGIRAWIEDSGLNNVLKPITLDVSDSWPRLQYDLVFSANTLHILSDQQALDLIDGLPDVMHCDSVCLIYGPFNYHGQYTSDSNRRFDAWLRQRDSNSGIKNFDWLRDRAADAGLECVHDFPMPANNRILVWQKSGCLSAVHETKPGGG